MLKHIKVLLIEDEKDVAFFERKLLEKYKNIDFEITHTTSLTDSLKIIGKRFFDVILLDLMLPNGEGMYVFNSIHEKCEDIPIVIVSGYEEHAMEAVKAGAQDYLIKPIKMNQLITSINYSIARKKAEEKCREDYRMLLNIFDNMDEMIYISDPDTYEILYMNESIKKTFGCSTGHKCYETFAGIDFPCIECHNEKIFGDNFGKDFTYEIKSGKNEKWYKSTIRAFQWPDGKLLRYTISIDISDRKEKEEKLSNFLEKKIEECNTRLKKSALHQQEQIQRLEKIRIDMTSDGVINGTI